MRFLIILVLLLPACASKSFVRKEIRDSERKLIMTHWDMRDRIGNMWQTIYDLRNEQNVR